ncbi:MAG TPA: hypothetical protein DCW90_13615 [Lachnospiraceae bacterium]|nr:hypothetical protein [Lachnospiraceae bacterium]
MLRLIHKSRKNQGGTAEYISSLIIFDKGRFFVYKKWSVTEFLINKKAPKKQGQNSHQRERKILCFAIFFK